MYFARPCLTCAIPRQSSRNQKPLVQVELCGWKVTWIIKSRSFNSEEWDIRDKINQRVRYDFQVSSISIEYIYLSISLLALVQFVMNSDLWEDWISPNIYSRIIYGNGERCRERKIRLFKWNERYRFEGDPISPIESARSICTYTREVGRSIVRVTYAGELV